MINAKELRIGNLVMAGKMAEPITVSTIGFELREGFMINTHIPIDHIHPIPLTGDLLSFKCGFDKVGKLKLTRRITLEWSYGNEFWLIDNDDSGSTIFEFENISSLHQLQNLYYALTSEELNIEL